MLQRIKEDASKAHLLPPADASLADLHKWYEELSKPVRLIPFPTEPSKPKEVGARAVDFDKDKSVGANKGISEAPLPPPKPPHTEAEEFFRPNRGWFLAAAGAVAVYILDRVDAPLWLALVTLVVLVGCAVIWPWTEKANRRRLWFWLLLGLYGILTLFLASIFTPSTKSEMTRIAASNTPTPVGTPILLATPPASLRSSPLPTPSPTTDYPDQIVIDPATGRRVRLARRMGPSNYFNGQVSLKVGGQYLDNVLAASGYSGSADLETLEFYNSSDTKICWRIGSNAVARCIEPGDGYNFPGGADAHYVYLVVSEDAKLDVGLKARETKVP